jgi:hypothetical protein
MLTACRELETLVEIYNAQPGAQKVQDLTLPQFLYLVSRLSNAITKEAAEKQLEEYDYKWGTHVEFIRRRLVRFFSYVHAYVPPKHLQKAKS